MVLHKFAEPEFPSSYIGDIAVALVSYKESESHKGFVFTLKGVQNSGKVFIGQPIIELRGIQGTAETV